MQFVMKSITKYVIESALKFVMLKNIKRIMVSRNLRQAHLLEVGMTKIPGEHETLFLVRHVGLRANFSSMKFSLGV